MSYSTRRSGGYAQQGSQQNVGNIGQRRPVVTNNFVPGGQLQQNKPAGAPPQQARPQQQAGGIQFRNQQAQQQQTPTANQQQTPVKPPVQQQTPVKPPVQQQTPVKPPVQQQTPAKPQVQQQTPAAKQLQQQTAAKQQVQPQAAAAAAAAAVKQQQQQQQQQAQQLQQQQQAQQLQQQQQQAQQLQQQQQAQQPVQTPQQTAQQEQLKMDEATNGDTPMEVEEVKKKHFWAKSGNRFPGRISKKEILRRRNVSLSKVLQPRNAVMILNELSKNTSYMVEELPEKYNDCQFKATAMYEGVEYVGYGRSKIQAKNSAAEEAIKQYVATSKLEMKIDDEGNENMDVSEEDSTPNPAPWAHVASFALYKLFSIWGDEQTAPRNNAPSSVCSEGRQRETKPAKKLPENPESINPLMLINQMLPQAHFEEIGKTGNPPHVVFSFRCNCDEQSFVGTGPNKKAARRMAAYGACAKMLGITYPPDVYVPSY